jgi:chromosome segregation ATPase
MMLSRDLENNIAHSSEAREIAQKTKAAKLQAKADSEGSLQDTTTTMQDDQKYLEDLVAECEQKGSDHAKTQQSRKDEIAALNKATEIISGGAVKGASEKHLPQLVQTAPATGDGTALAQLRSDGRSPTQPRVAAYLRSKANELNSKLLSALAVRVESDPFKKIKKMIKDLITKLLEEANEEATHKGWCDVELGTNKQTRDEKTEAVVTLTAEIDELTASIAKLSEEITELMQAVSELDAAVAEATSIRDAEKAKNTVTISDAQEAQKAVAQALNVLREFYAKQGAAFVQEQQESTETSDEQNKGTSGDSSGVIHMLEVIESDFARLEAET